MGGPSKKTIAAQQQPLDQRQVSASEDHESVSSDSNTLVPPSPPLEAGVALGSVETWSPEWDYHGQDADTASGGFVGFLTLIGPVAAPPTKLLRFVLADGLESSGVLEFLDINLDNPSAATQQPLTDLQHSARAILCHAIDNQRRGLSASSRLEATDIYLKPVLDAYIKLLSACKDVECIEMPLKWACVFRAEDVFPKVGMNDVENLDVFPVEMTARWGQLPEPDERSLQRE
ncbi:uncharacterized protein N0V89_012528 [Didymosphaeria variabile]|uniref:Uncharacterized protein n=1 Tax=Didymosphaeria variabile TaxID=1932322 RepID=A0A9W8XB91_9PLEO|nr:uncharacterized protein N0V89_012528 [Didymosphaeria variabile]KAJ4344784.1 hypothetical protein N0V89_012528 [Didymosphaeria variabile]